MPTARTPSSTDPLEHLEEGLPLLGAEVTQPSLDEVIDSLDEGLPIAASREPSRRLPFAEPALPEPAEDSSVPVGFILLMLLVGASTAALVFHSRLSQIW